MHRSRIGRRRGGKIDGRGVPRHVNVSRTIHDNSIRDGRGRESVLQGVTQFALYCLAMPPPKYEPMRTLISCACESALIKLRTAASAKVTIAFTRHLRTR